mmetsp:Transcript_52645/g.94500  ORF Transcript_52645/g.94500 Transcript_52645/m.94500 type:complete len:338 (+) Transcript_52645:63-1076(+)
MYPSNGPLHQVHVDAAGRGVQYEMLNLVESSPGLLVSSHLVDSGSGQFTTLQILWICVLTAVFAACCMACIRMLVRPKTDVARLHSVMYTLHLYAWVNFTIIIIESYDLATALGKQSPSMSGHLIGFYSLGAAPGSLFLYCLDRKWPELWKSHTKEVLTSAGLVSLLGSLSLGVASLLAQDQTQHQADLERLAGVSLAARCVSGFASGAINQFNYANMPRVTSTQERPDATLLLFMMCMLGLGLGPVAASVGYSAAPTASFGLAGIQSAILSSAMMISTSAVSMAASLPCDREESSDHPKERAQQEKKQQDLSVEKRAGTHTETLERERERCTWTNP